MASESRICSAEAGRCGKGVQSDCWVKVTLADAGGIDLQLKRQVESIGDEAARKLVQDELAALGVQHARVELEDNGALPFVIMARVETAVRRLRKSHGTSFQPPDGYPPEFADGTGYTTERDRLRRSRLYLPGNEPRLILDAGTHAPDGGVLDLEDSVAPGEKDAARILVRNALRSIDFNGAERIVRINQGELGLEDLDAVVPQNVHAILIPRVEDPKQVNAVDARIRNILASRATYRPIYLVPIIESALGALRAYEIASASKSVVALTIGLDDYTADIGTVRTSEGRESFWARCQVVNAARAADVQPIDSVFSDVADMEGLRQSVLEAKSLGFEGMGCIHPRQIAVIHEAFTPTPEELEGARKIVAAFQEAEAKGLDVVALGSKMIDPPVVKRAQRIVKLADATARE